MAELGVRNQLAVEENGGADAGAKRQQNDDAHAALTRAKADFGDTCGVRVVDHRHRTAHVTGKKLARVGAYP